MKKNKFLFIIAIIYFLIPIFVYAGEIRFNNPTQKSKNVYTFTLTAEDVSLNYITGDLSTPNATITSVTMASGWKNATGKNNHFYFYHDGKSSGNYKIATFEVKITDDSYYKVSNLNYGINKCSVDMYNNYFGENGSLVSKDKYNQTCLLSKDATLKSLSISSGVLSPSFDSALELYSANVENNISSVTFKAVPNNEKAIVSGATCALNVGLNTCKIIVKAEAGNTKTYTVTVTRKNKASNPPIVSSDASISNLVVHGGTLQTAFNSNVREYNLKVDKNAESIYFTFEINSNNQKFTSEKCSIFADTCKLTITAEDGISKITYIFHLINENTNFGNSASSSNSSTTNTSTNKNNSSSNVSSVNTTQNQNNSSNNTNNSNKNPDAITEEPSNNKTESGSPTISTEENNENKEEEKTENVENQKEDKKENKNILKYAIYLFGLIVIVYLFISNLRARVNNSNKNSTKKKNKKVK